MSRLLPVIGLWMTIALVAAFTVNCVGWEDCVRTMGKRPCITSTVRYEGGGECSCETKHRGKIMWDGSGE